MDSGERAFDTELHVFIFRYKLGTCIFHRDLIEILCECMKILLIFWFQRLFELALSKY